MFGDPDYLFSVHANILIPNIIDLIPAVRDETLKYTDLACDEILPETT